MNQSRAMRARRDQSGTFAAVAAHPAGFLDLCARSRQAGMMRQTHWILALWIFVIAFTPLLAGAAGAQPLDRNLALCTGDTDSDDTVIDACTAVIMSGQQPDVMLVIAYKNLCLAHNDKGEHDRAMQDCDQAIQLDPGYGQAYLFRGHANFNKGDYDSAIEDYDQAIALGSDAAASFVERGAAYHRKGDEAHAIADLDQAITLDPNDPTAFYIRGAAYQAQSDNDHAIQDYGQAIRLAPNFAASLYRRGVLELKIGDARAGDADIARARQIDPGMGK